MVSLLFSFTCSALNWIWCVTVSRNAWTNQMRCVRSLTGVSRPIRHQKRFSSKVSTRTNTRCIRPWRMRRPVQKHTSGVLVMATVCQCSFGATVSTTARVAKTKWAARATRVQGFTAVGTPECVFTLNTFVTLRSSVRTTTTRCSAKSVVPRCARASDGLLSAAILSWLFYTRSCATWTPGRAG